MEPYTFLVCYTPQGHYVVHSAGIGRASHADDTHGFDPMAFVLFQGRLQGIEANLKPVVGR